MRLTDGQAYERRHGKARADHSDAEPHENRPPRPVETQEYGVRQEHQCEVHVEQNRRRHRRCITEPDPIVVAACRNNQQYGRPRGNHHRQCVRTGFNARPCRAGQDRADDPGAQSDGARRELLAQHHHTGRRTSDCQTAWHARPEFCGFEDHEPAVHEHVVQAVDGIDVAHHLPQLPEGAAVGRRDRRGLVVPERRAASAHEAERGGEDSHDDGVEHDHPRSRQDSLPKHAAMLPDAGRMPSRARGSTRCRCPVLA